LKKSKYRQQVSVSSLSELEFAALSLTELQGDPHFKGPVQKKFTAPLLKSSKILLLLILKAQIVDFMSLPGCLISA
jgi:hypothetical protein